MTESIWVLTITAASIGLFHTLLGPDHYIPFIAMGRSRQWSLSKTAMITFVCGTGHVLGSVVLGLIGVTVGLAIEDLEYFETARGKWAAWALIAFGTLYLVYGVFHALRNKPHSHLHIHSDGSVHSHEHTHHNEHAHLHDEGKLERPVPWVLFVIFILGPCESLIPLLMYPAAQHSITGIAMVVMTFGVVTIATMLLVVLVGTYGLNFSPMKKAERYTHAIAGFSIIVCGWSVQYLGL